jgi:DNA-directed RNA polymerase specialized sigma24 family protein
MEKPPKDELIEKAVRALELSLDQAFIRARRFPPDMQRDIATGLAQLPEAQRAALVLCFEHGLTHEEAAAALECPLGTLKSHVARGRARLRAWMES